MITPVVRSGKGSNEWDTDDAAMRQRIGLVAELLSPMVPSYGVEIAGAVTALVSAMQYELSAADIARALLALREDQGK